MATKTETPITQAIIRRIKHNGGDAYHVHGSIEQRGGEPDITGEIETWYGWKHLKIEVKTPVGNVSKRQLFRLRKYHQRGYWVGIVTSVKEYDTLIERYILGEDDGDKEPYFYCDLPYGKELYAKDINGTVVSSEPDDGFCSEGTE